MSVVNARESRPNAWNTKYGWMWLPEDSTIRVRAERMATHQGRSVTQVVVSKENYERLHEIEVIVSKQGRNVQVFVDGVKFVKEDSR